jgi:hypothetical protein
MKWAAVAAFLKAAYEKVKKFFSSSGVTQKGEGNRNISGVNMGNSSGPVIFGDIHIKPELEAPTPKTREIDLSARAARILFESSQAPNAAIIHFARIGNCVVQIGLKHFGAHDNPEQEAECRDDMNKLIHECLIGTDDPKQEVWSLTSAGYKVVAQLKQNSEAMSRAMAVEQEKDD